jgi:hypothetical protein
MANTQRDGTDGRADDRSADRPDRAAPLEPGQGTVGSHIDIRHLAATPIGMRVTFRATLTERDGRRREGVDHVGVRGHRHLGTHGQRHLRDPLLGVPAHGRGTDQCAPPRIGEDLEPSLGGSLGGGPSAGGRSTCWSSGTGVGLVD